ncbi:MAG: EAL domain-containing protein [Lachnospiraceae bacterium]|nr:EAL domain-containing protein [Lachnospiraceae bacterium]
MDQKKVDNERLALIDYLTGLENRRGLYAHFESYPDGSFIHAMFIDLDNFKKVNDIYGHAAGDELLSVVSGMIREQSRAYVARIGGDEFVILFPEEEYDRKTVENIAKSMLEGIRQLSFRQDIMSWVSLSLGIVYHQAVSKGLDDILAKCDTAMYQAKFNGKAQYAVYKDDKEVRYNHTIEVEMEDALKKGQFQVYFQPKINMVTSQLIGAEALSRWVHPQEGVRLPAKYIELFERNGFITRLDYYVFEEVCRIKQGWKGQRYADVPVSVNFSRRHLYNDRFPMELAEIADRYGIPHEQLEIEITERVFIRDSDEIIQMVDCLQKQGFLVSIDDFGSGFSALNLLKDIAIDTVKIDRGFLHISSDTDRGKTIIKNIIRMCRDLKVEVITEGVETKEQVDFLTSCGCQLAQGFYYAMPIPLDEFEEFAHQYTSNPRDHFTFPLDGDLSSKTGVKTAKAVGKYSFVDGIFKDTKAIHFPGGPTGQNVVHIPIDTIINDSFTISLWIRPTHNYIWTSALYIKFETGFLTINPLIVENMSAVRDRDSTEINGWYDLTGLPLQENVWWHFVVTYNAKTEILATYINGEPTNRMEKVPTNYLVKWIILGGDVFQPSFEGDICQLQIYNEPKDPDFVHKLHDTYRTREDFVAFAYTPEE